MQPHKMRVRVQNQAQSPVKTSCYPNPLGSSLLKTQVLLQHLLALMQKLQAKKLTLWIACSKQANAASLSQVSNATELIDMAVWHAMQVSACCSNQSILPYIRHLCICVNCSTNQLVSRPTCIVCQALKQTPFTAGAKSCKVCAKGAKLWSCGSCDALLHEKCAAELPEPLYDYCLFCPDCKREPWHRGAIILVCIAPDTSLASLLTGS